MKKKKIAIFIALHKECKVPNNKLYIPLQVGAEGKKELGYLKDNTKDNISAKNPNFCELTGLYWIWKNRNDDIVGLVHYRRYFFKHFYEHKLNQILEQQDIEKALNEYDIILPKRVKIPKHTVKGLYGRYHKISDYEKCREIIKKKYPAYLDSFDKISKERSFYAYNMFIMKKQDFNEYCSWLFDILFELEKDTDIKEYDKYNSRIYGFLSERLFNVWIREKSLKTKEYYVYNTEESIIKQNLICLIKKIFIRG